MSIKSMTGFGQAEAKTPSGSYRVEIRSVNNRFLDIQIRQPRFFSTLEIRIKQAVSAAVARGSLSVVISSMGEEAASAVSWDKSAVDNYLRVFKDIKKSCGIVGEITLADFLAFPEIFKAKATAWDDETLWKHVGPILEAALKDFDRSRAKEGLLLTQDLKKMLKSVDQDNRKVLRRAPARLKDYRETLQKRIGELLAAQPDPTRIAQEVAFMADRIDIAEECTRLGAHVKNFQEMFDSTEPVGKRMNFLLQEMNREANTIGSKANDTEIGHLSVELKEYIEKIREQIQNIE